MFKITRKNLNSLVGKYILNKSSKSPPKEIIRVDHSKEEFYEIICPKNNSYSISFANRFCIILTKEENPEYFL